RRKGEGRRQLTFGQPRNTTTGAVVLIVRMPAPVVFRLPSPRRLCRRDSCAVGTPSPGPLRPRNAVNRQILEPFRSPLPQCPPDAIPAASGRLLQAGRNDKDPRRSER